MLAVLVICISSEICVFIPLDCQKYDKNRSGNSIKTSCKNSHSSSVELWSVLPGSWWDVSLSYWCIQILVFVSHREQIKLKIWSLSLLKLTLQKRTIHSWINHRWTHESTCFDNSRNFKLATSIHARLYIMQLVPCIFDNERQPTRYRAYIQTH